MNTLDLHPEELFDKAALGTLSDSERIWLDGHLEQCEVCRFEQQVRADFEAEPLAALNVDSLVTRALSGMPAAAPRAEKTFNRSNRRTVAMIAGTALAFSTMASFAAVAQWTGVWPKIVEAFVGAPPPPPPVAPVVSSRHVRAEPAPVSPVEGPAIEVPAALEPVVEAPVAPVVAAPAPGVKRAAPPPPAPPAAPVVVENASVLFDRANQQRIQGSQNEAVSTYRELLVRFPSAPEANLTRATLGRLLLDIGEAAGSLNHLEAYLRTGELTLREEVLSARAVALSRLNRTTEEAAAWSALLDAYPDSIHAVRAKARLEELGQH
jgi:hypothetical protein